MRTKLLIFLILLLLPVHAGASLRLGAATSDSLGYGTLGSYSMNPVTVVGWYRPTTLTSPRRLWAKQATSFLICQVLATGTGGIRCRNDRTVAQAYDTSGCFGSTNTWYFIATTFDEGASATNFFHIYQGTLTTPVTECAYAVQTDGSGTWGDYTTNNFTVGNSDTLSQSFQGDISRVLVVNRVLTLGEIRNLQYKMAPVAGTLLYSEIGLAGAAGTQPDWSGKKNSGTVTGATIAPPVPTSLVSVSPVAYKFNTDKLLALRDMFDPLAIIKRFKFL